MAASDAVDAVYVALPVPPSAGALVDAVRTLGLAGANVTVPHKARVLGTWPLVLGCNAVAAAKVLGIENSHQNAGAQQENRWYYLVPQCSCEAAAVCSLASCCESGSQRFMRLTGFTSCLGYRP